MMDSKRENKKVIHVAMYCRMARDNDKEQNQQEREIFPEDTEKKQQILKRKKQGKSLS